MAQSKIGPHGPVVLGMEEIDKLLEALRERGYRVAGPSLYEGVIRYREISSMQDLPQGVRDSQKPGSYRTERNGHREYFHYAVGPDSLKAYFSPAKRVLWTATRDRKGLHCEESPAPTHRSAFFGVRPCDLAALLAQDKVFLEGPFVDPYYRSVRESTFIAVVNCLEPAETCFCASMGSGPQAMTGYDLCLTELASEKRHEFLVEIGSDRGREILQTVGGKEAAPKDLALAEELLANSSTKLNRELDRKGIEDLFRRHFEDPHWDAVAERCLSCGNCTQVCPTCFCTTVHDETDLTGKTARRVRVSDSCFAVDFSYIHGGSVRASEKARYRQWLTHKLVHWESQFGNSGCVGCGRCITWCPVGIDLTEEVRSIRERDRKASGSRRREVVKNEDDQG